MTKIILAALLASICMCSCVQKAYKKTVVITLNTAGNTNIKTVGIRGEGKPLSWREDIPMQEVIKDSIYTATVSAVTGYKFTEIKFTINGEFELQEKDNRRVSFADGDTTFYNAIFNTNKQ
jgi:hypothetical protein